MTLPNLLDILETFDGKHTSGLEGVAVRVHAAPPLTDLIVLAESPKIHVQIGATWLLKRLQEMGATFSSSQVEDVLGLFEHVDHWGATLHLLQMLPGFTISANQKNGLFSYLKTALASRKPFVRAWSYNGLAVLANQYSELEIEVKTLLDRGAQDKAASVRARIRNIRKAMSKN